MIDPSERAPLGQTSLRVTRLGLGTSAIGGYFGPVATAEAEAVIRRSFELGLRLFDTAPAYGNGEAEHRLGQVLPDLPRAEVVISTKVGRSLRQVSLSGKGGQALRRLVRGDVRQLRLMAAKAAHRLRQARQKDTTSAQLAESAFDFSYDGVMRTVEESLRRLNVDRVDILHLHDPDDHVEAALNGAYRALDRLRSEGAVTALGVGTSRSDVLARFAREARFDCFLLAGRYTLLDQTALTDILPICVEQGASILIGGVYNGGILVNPRPSATFDYHAADRRLVEQARRLDAVCARHGVPLKAAALQFPLAHPAVASVLLGVRSVAELKQNVSLLHTPIPQDLWQELRAEGLLPQTAPTPVPQVIDAHSGVQ